MFSLEFTVNISDDLKKLNLAGAYIAARKRNLLPAMEKSATASRRAVTPMIPIGATGAASRSMISSAGQTPYMTIGKVTSSMRRPNIYIYVMNAGRPAGKKRPPSNALVPWVQEKGLASSFKEAQRIAFLIARAIQKRGITGISFMWNGLDKTKGQIESIHRSAVEAIARELGGNA